MKPENDTRVSTMKARTSANLQAKVYDRNAWGFGRPIRARLSVTEMSLAPILFRRQT